MKSRFTIVNIHLDQFIHKQIDRVVHNNVYNDFEW